MGICYVAWLVDDDTWARYQDAKNKSKFCKRLFKDQDKETLMFGDSTNFWPLECALRVLRSRGVVVPEEQSEHMQLELDRGQCAAALDQVIALGPEGVTVTPEAAADEMVQLREKDDAWADAIRDGEVDVGQVLADFIASLKLAVATKQAILIWAPY